MKRVGSSILTISGIFMAFGFAAACASNSDSLLAPSGTSGSGSGSASGNSETGASGATGGTGSTGGDGGTSGIAPGTQEFESDDPSQRYPTRPQWLDSGVASPPTQGESTGADGGSRAIEEADIIKVDGNRLFALSSTGGLAVVDITDPAHLRLLGRKRTRGIPFEMYVRDGRAYVMMNDYGRWVPNEPDDGDGRWVQTSELLALDLTAPNAIAEVAHYDVPGSIADSRLVGDSLYLVTYENGYCWQCGTMPGTIVTSFHVEPTKFSQVDQLTYRATSPNSYTWQRSVSATDKRLYIAGPQWSWEPGTPNGQSIIQAVDISDPTGRLVKGADITVAGQINSRWQMDEYQGVLRVVSQHGAGWWGPNGTVNPEVQTFTITSSSDIKPLGKTELILHKPESLRSVRFDGARGYAITAERTDPLFTIDLSEPATPKQVGELEMPGWIFHMEPRGDRLIGFGYDDTVGSTANLSVGLFDVSNLAKPTLLKSVSYGSGWGYLGEDPDRIHKLVRVLDDQGLILIPFQSYARKVDDGKCEAAKSGIQLIDYSKNDLVARGVAPQRGLPRRAFIANDRLFAVSDRNVSTFDITSRDAPVKATEIELSNPAYQMVAVGQHIASISNDWMTGEAVLSLIPREAGNDITVTGRLSLAGMADPHQQCDYSSWNAWYSARVFSQGSFVYVAVPVYSWSANTANTVWKIGVIDVTDPASPKLVGTSQFEGLNQADARYLGSTNVDGYNDRGRLSLLLSGDSIAQVGSKLAFLEYSWTPKPSQDAGTNNEVSLQRQLRVVDLSTPTTPKVLAPVVLGESLDVTTLTVYGNTVMTSSWKDSPKVPGKVRFYVDRVDLTGADPKVLSPINVPGTLLSVDEQSKRWVTADYAVQRTPMAERHECETVSSRWFDFSTNECVSVTYTLHLLNELDGSVSLQNSFALPSQNVVGTVRTSADRLYIARQPRYTYRTDDAGGGRNVRVEDGGLWAIGGIRSGALSIVSSFTNEAGSPIAVDGSRIAVVSGTNGLTIYDTATAAPTKVAEVTLSGSNRNYSAILAPDRVIVSLGEYGLQTLPF